MNIPKASLSSYLKQAATYVRMSTDRQSYSTSHQMAHLSDFAARRGLEIVKTYSDEGKSGLAIKGRPGLRRLIEDVQSGTAPFATILVYDVSRWGRFQDVDESAYYEFVCRSQEIHVLYCAEQFENDGSPMAALIKSVKRTMAAEYSRELSSKVFSAQCRFIALGFKQGGSPGYGLRRLLVGPDGTPKRILLAGERKGATTDRVTFVVGPAEEISVLRRIYSMYIEERLPVTAIAGILNSEGTASEFGRPWTPWLVRSVLTNEKYLGHIVFNRGSFKLKRKAIKNPPEMWIRFPGAFESPLAHGVFELAQAERRRRMLRPDKEMLLDSVRDVFRRCGKVTTTLLTHHVNSSMPKLLARHFGTITNAYSLAGIPSTSTFSYVETRRFVATTRKGTISRVLDLCHSRAATAMPIGGRDRLVLNGVVRVQIVVIRCRGGRATRARWKLSFRSIYDMDFVIGVQLAVDNQSILQYLLIPVHAVNGDMTFREELPREHVDLSYARLEDMFLAR